MVNRLRHLFLIRMLAVIATLCVSHRAVAQQAGTIRGTVFDADFETPIAGVRVTVAETGVTVASSEQGAYVIADVAPGEYTLVFVREGYIQEVQSEVLVNPGQLTNVATTRLKNDFQEMDEFIIREIKFDAGSEESLLELRFDSPQLVDSIGSDFLSRAGASDAAAGLRLISGATTTADGFAAVRGLPPRYVSTQLNGFVLPSADPDTRSVQLDLFPSEVIESIQVSKSFTPDQQGSASGGGVDIVTKSIPDENFLKLSSKVKVNSQQAGSGEFLQDGRGEVPFFGGTGARELIGALSGLSNTDPLPGGLDPLPFDQFGSPAPVFGDTPVQYEMNLAAGLRHTLDSGITIGGVMSSFWSQDTSHDDGRIDRDLEALTNNLGVGMIPDINTNDATGFLTTSDLGGEQRLTSLFDETRSEQEVTWGGLATLGVESENHRIGVTFMRTQITTSTVTISEDTTGKSVKFTGHDPNAVSTPGGSDNTASTDAFGQAIATGDDFRDFAPYRRLETQEYLKRTVQSLQFRGDHKLPILEDGVGWDGLIEFKNPEIDWHYANSRADRDEPGTTFFDSKTLSPRVAGPFVIHESQLVSAPTNDVGPYNIVYRDIDERGDQYRVNLVLPFEQWSGESGSIKLGFFVDSTTRKYSQDTFALLNNSLNFLESFDGTRLSEAYLDPTQYPLDTSSPPDASGFLSSDRGSLEQTGIDFTMRGQQDIEAFYWMIDLPLNKYVTVIGGYRYESTRLNSVITPDNPTLPQPLLIDAKELIDAGLGTIANSGNLISANKLEGAGISLDSDIDQADILPSLGLKITPLEGLIIRGSYSQTIARPTFRELTPLSQSLVVGQTPYVGNPLLEMSSVDNWDLRVDYRPQQGTMFSISYFRKDVENVIQNIQQTQGTTNFIVPINFPQAEIEGWEFEARQDMGRLYDSLSGLTLGGNLTLLDTAVTLRDFEQVDLAAAGVAQSTVEMTDAPQFLANLYVTYDIEETGTRASLFYTMRGDALIAGPTVGGSGDVFYTPAIYETAYDSLNFTLSQKLGKYLTLSFSAKNLTNPDIETVYRSSYVPGGDVLKTRSSKGIDFSLGIGASFDF